MEEDTRKKNFDRAQKSKVAYEKATKQRATEVQKTRISYQRVAKDPAFLDMIDKIKLMQEAATEQAVFGAAFDAQGQEIILSPDKVSRLLGEAAGFKKLLMYLERQMTPAPAPDPKDKKVA